MLDKMNLKLYMKNIIRHITALYLMAISFVCFGQSETASQNNKELTLAGMCSYNKDISYDYLQGRSYNYFVTDDTTRSAKRKGPFYSRRLRFDASMAHWTSDRFRTPVLGNKFSFGLGWNPGIKFLQLQARYDYSSIRLTSGDTLNKQFEGKSIGFTNLGLAIGDEFTNNNRTVIVNNSLGLVLVSIEDRKTVPGLSAGFGIDYLIKHPQWKKFSLGYSISMRSQIYNLTDHKAKLTEWFTGKKDILDRDASYSIGIVFSFN